MARGTISDLQPHQGFGFILEDGDSEEIEFHASAFEAGSLEQLRVGQAVEFDKQADHRNPSRIRAVNVRLVRPGR